MNKIKYIGVLMAGCVAISINVISVFMNGKFGYSMGNDAESQTLFSLVAGGIEVGNIALAAFLVVIAKHLKDSKKAAWGYYAAIALFSVVSLTSSVGLFVKNRFVQTETAKNLAVKDVTIASNLSDSKVEKFQLKSRILAYEDRKFANSDKISALTNKNNALKSNKTTSSILSFLRLRKCSLRSRLMWGTCVEARSHLNDANMRSANLKSISSLEDKNRSLDDKISAANVLLDKIQLNIEAGKKKVLSKTVKVTEDQQIKVFSKITGVAGFWVLVSLVFLIACGFQLACLFSMHVFSSLFYNLVMSHEAQKQAVSETSSNKTDNASSPFVDPDTGYNSVLDTDLLAKAIAGVEAQEAEDFAHVRPVSVNPSADMQADKMVAALGGAHVMLSKAQQGAESIRQFISQGTAAKSGFVRTSELYEAYQKYCELSGIAFITKAPFDETLEFVLLDFEGVELIKKTNQNWVSGIEPVSIQRRDVA